MKLYQPSKYSELVLRYLSIKGLKIIMPVLFIAVFITSFINYTIMLILGAIFILLVIMRLSVIYIENKRITKYCKENNITIDEFNIMNKS